MQEKELIKYKKIKENWGTSYGGTNHAKNYYTFLTTIFNYFLHITVADVGCGEGQFPIWVKNNFPTFEVYGIEPVFANYGYNNGVHFLKGDFTNLPIEKVDILTSFDVMEHVCYEDLDKTLEEIHRVTTFYICKIATKQGIVKGVDGEELHPIVQPIEWWIKCLKKYFKQVCYVNGLVICKIKR